MSQTKAQLVGGVGFSTADSLTVHNGLAVTGVVTATSFVGNISGDATGLTGSPNITVTNITASGNVTVGGTLTYEDVTNIDSIGIVTARSGINITGAGMTVTGIGTFRDSVNLLSGASVTGVVTATSFVGDITGTASNASGATSDFSIADKIVHTGDTNTAIRFPAADTFSVETAGSEALRVDSGGRLLVGHTSAAENNNMFEVSTTYGGRIGFLRDDTTTAAGNNLGMLSFYGNDSNGTYQESARIQVDADLDHATGDKPGRISFLTSPDGSNTPAERLRVTSTGGFHFTNAELIERVNITAGKLSDNLNINLDNGMIHHFTTTETTTATPNITSTAGINTNMAVGDAMSVTIITTAAAAGYAATVHIDGLPLSNNGGSLNWTGGSAPSTGGSSGVDIYAYMIMKTASAKYTAIATLTTTAA